MNKTSMPRISVITVCLNAAPSMKITLESVISQKYTNKEIIIIDGASVDGTLDVVKLYSSHIDRIVSEKDRGIYDAMNKGVALATGDYCIFMNAGDTFADCDTLAKAFQKPTDADVLYGDVIKTDKNGKNVKRAELPHNSHRMFFCHQSAFSRTTCLKEYPFDTSYTMSADFKLYKTLIKCGKTFQYLQFPVSVFDTNGISNVKRSKGLRQNINVIKETDGLIDKLRFLPRLYFVMYLSLLRGK